MRVLRLDGGGEQRDVGAPRRGVAVGHHRVEPGGVELAGQHLGPVEQVEQERLVGGAAVDHRGGLAQRAGQPRAGLVAVAAPRDDLGDHGVELRRDGVARRHAGVDAHARPGGQVQVLDVAGRGGEALLGVLGGEPGLDRVPARRRRLRRDLRQLAAARDVQLQLDDVDAGGRLGDAVLHLQPGVDLEEREQALARLVEELDRARVDVARGLRQRGGRAAQELLLLGVQRDGGGLLEHLLVAPLHRAVAHTERPDVAGGVRDDLHLDVAAAGDRALHEHGGVARGLGALGGGALEGLGEVLWPLDLADAAAAAARRRLDHERVADAFGVLAGRGDVGDRPVRPRCHRHADLLGQQLRGDLVAEPLHDLGGGADEHDVHVAAQPGELGLLRHEAPARPHGVGAGERRGARRSSA